MEYVFSALSLLVVWAIPAMLVLAVVAFVVGAPAVAVAGGVAGVIQSARAKHPVNAEEAQLLPKTTR